MHINKKNHFKITYQHHHLEINTMKILMCSVSEFSCVCVYSYIDFIFFLFNFSIFLI